MNSVLSILLEAKDSGLQFAKAFTSHASMAYTNATVSQSTGTVMKLFQSFSLTYIVKTCVELALLYALLRGTYLLYFHPLAKFPGPKLGAVSKIYGNYMCLGGLYHLHSERLHKKYGPVVRISPNDISFCSTTAYKTIHSDPKQKFVKSPKYRLMATRPANLVTERDPALHTQKKKRIQNAFSHRALSEQEDLVTHWVDFLVDKLGEYGEKGNKPLDAANWYNMTTFDIIGDLAFGESFGSLDKGKQHYWIDVIFDNIKLATYLSIINDYPWIESLFKLIVPVLVPKKLVAAGRKHAEYGLEKIKRRVNLKTSRKDFMSHILANKGDPAIENIEYLSMEAGLLAVAGSETTATFLSGTTWLLCKNPEAYRKLTSEIRNAFTSYDEISQATTQHLPYMNAVIEESLRYFPPVPLSLRRVSPGAMIDGYYVPAGTIVSVCPRTMTRSEKYWARPNEFCPERWLPKDHPDYSHEFDNDDHQASQPFSIGPRGCIGRNLAYMEMRLILSKILWRYDLTLNNREQEQRWMEDGRLKMYNMWEKPALQVKFTPIR